MTVDVQTEIEVERPRAEVATYAGDPDNATDWYKNIESVEWKTGRPLEVGSRVAFVARFLGRRLAYTYVIRELIPGERLVMSTADGPFAMETTYTWTSTPTGTLMTLRNRGEPAGFSKVAAPMMSRAMRRANQNDLRLLKQILEDETSGQPRRRPPQRRESGPAQTFWMGRLAARLPRLAARLPTGATHPPHRADVRR